MKNSLKVCYSIRENIGNAINPFIIEKILGRKVIWADEYNCQTSGIGSGLRLFYRRPESINRDKLNSANCFPCQIWSAGFLTTPNDTIQPIKEQLCISSVRGNHSKAILNKIYGNKWDISVGDAGLLASELILPPSYKKYHLGIIPHDRERDELKYCEIQYNTPNSIIIDVREHPIDALKKITQCSCIISSSLHGLIFADSFGIPNQWVRLTNKILGDGFKFHDYYSVFNLKKMPLDLNYINRINIEQIIANYNIPLDEISSLKENIIKSFYRYI